MYNGYLCDRDKINRVPYISGRRDKCMTLITERSTQSSEIEA